MKKIINRIALIGATSRKDKYGNIIFLDLLQKGYDVYPVHPVLKTIEGYKVYNKIKELPNNIDLYVFVVPWRSGLYTVSNLIESGKNNFWFQPGAESRELSDYLNKDENIKYNMNECIMIRSNKRGDLLF